MTRDTFFDFLDKSLGKSSLEEKADICKKIHEDWIQDYTSNLLQGEKYCEHCKKYYKKADFKFVEETERFFDNYEGALEAEGIFLYSYCPKCNHRTRESEISREVIRWL